MSSSILSGAKLLVVLCMLIEAFLVVFRKTFSREHLALLVRMVVGHKVLVKMLTVRYYYVLHTLHTYIALGGKFLPSSLFFTYNKVYKNNLIFPISIKPRLKLRGQHFYILVWTVSGMLGKSRRYNFLNWFVVFLCHCFTSCTYWEQNKMK